MVLAGCIALLHSMVALYMISIVFCVFKKNLPAWYLNIQMGIIGIACVFNISTGVCPLTFIEKKLRALAGLEVYDGNFLNHYFQTFFNITLSDQLIYRSIMGFLFLLIVIIIRRVALKRRVVAQQAQ